jgi:DNA-binding NarL/FixJ family response regulator
MRPIRIVLADDHTLVRAGLRALLEKLSGVEVVGEAGDGREALKLIEAGNPDLVLMDLAMPGFDGAEATARISRTAPKTRVIVVSVHGDPESVLRAIDAGAAGYMSKDASVPELEIAIRSVMRGGTYLSPSISQHVLSPSTCSTTIARGSRTLARGIRAICMVGRAHGSRASPRVSVRSCSSLRKARRRARWRAR